MKLNARTAGRCRRRLDHVSDRERATPVALAQGPPALHGCAVPVAGPRHPVFPFAKTFQLGRPPIRLNRSYFPSQPLQYLQYQRDFPRKPIMLDYVMPFFSRAVVID